MGGVAAGDRPRRRAVVVMTSSPVTPEVDWISSDVLDGLTRLSAEDRRRIGKIVEHRTIGYTFRAEGLPWWIHKGDLTVAGNSDGFIPLLDQGVPADDGQQLPVTAVGIDRDGGAAGDGAARPRQAGDRRPAQARRRRRPRLAGGVAVVGGLRVAAVAEVQGARLENRDFSQ